MTSGLQVECESKHNQDREGGSKAQVNKSVK